jgi:hypothetical protein
MPRKGVSWDYFYNSSHARHCILKGHKSKSSNVQETAFSDCFPLRLQCSQRAFILTLRMHFRRIVSAHGHDLLCKACHLVQKTSSLAFLEWSQGLQKSQKSLNGCLIQHHSHQLSSQIYKMTGLAAKRSHSHHIWPAFGGRNWSVYWTSIFKQVLQQS